MVIVQALCVLYAVGIVALTAVILYDEYRYRQRCARAPRAPGLTRDVHVLDRGWRVRRLARDHQHRSV